MNRPFRLALALILAASPAASAQEEPAVGPEIAEKIPKHLENTVRVRFTLKNGSRVTGFVKNGQFVESIRDHRFVAGEKLEGSGVRVWPEDVQEESGFIFLEWGQIRDIEIIRPMTTAEAVEEEKAEERARRERLERLRRLEAETASYFDEMTKKEEAERLAAAEAEAAKAAEALEEEKRRARALLQRFPPDAGWSQERYDGLVAQLQQNRALRGEEKAFYDGFELWKKAIEWKAAGELEEPIPEEPIEGTEGAEEPGKAPAEPRPGTSTGPGAPPAAPPSPPGPTGGQPPR